MQKFNAFTCLLLTAVLLCSCNRNKIALEEIELIPVGVGNEFQYINTDGKIIINPQFAQASVFREGLALVQSSGSDHKWGYISEDGKFKIPAIYKSATVFSEGLAWVVTENSAPSAINTNGEVQFTLHNAENVMLFKEGLAAFSKEDDNKKIWGFVDKEGKIKINPQFLNVGYFSDGKSPVSNINGKWGYVDKEGKLNINYQFDKAQAFINGTAVVAFNGKFGIIDDDGRYLINPQFDNIINDGDLYLIQQGGKYGWTDKEGKIVINPQFLDAYPFSSYKLAAVKSASGWQYVDKEGKIIINPQFENAFPFNGNLALVLNANKIGFINNEGKYVINPQFDVVSPDLISHLESGSSSYKMITSDFFDLNAIINAIDFDKPEGISLDMPISSILKKFKIESSQLDKNSSKTFLISGKRLSNDAAIDFFMYAYPWEVIPVQQIVGWEQTTVMNYRFIDEMLPSSFCYIINLSYRVSGKETLIKDALVKKMNGFKFDPTNSTENSFVFTSSNKNIKIDVNSGQLILNYIPFPNGD